MKVVIFVVAALAVVQSIDCYAVSEMDSRELVDQLNLKLLKAQLQQRLQIEAVKSKIDDVCPGYGDRFENVTAEIQSCAALVDEDQETMCSIVKNHFERCMTPLTNMFDECLPQKSRKIPSLIVKMLLAATNHLCKSDGEHIFELGNTCVKNINPKTERCMRRVAVRFQQISRTNKYPSSEDMCELFESLRPCFQSHLNTACGHPITREAFLQTYDKVLSVCKTYEQNEIEVLEPVVQ